MKIVFKKEFVAKLSAQVDYIAQDSVSRAEKFKSDLLSQLSMLPRFPYACRKSIYFENKNIRDFIFKGYIIVYRINNDRIEVFGLVKYKKEP